MTYPIQLVTGGPIHRRIIGGTLQKKNHNQGTGGRRYLPWAQARAQWQAEADGSYVLPRRAIGKTSLLSILTIGCCYAWRTPIVALIQRCLFA